MNKNFEQTKEIEFPPHPTIIGKKYNEIPDDKQEDLRKSIIQKGGQNLTPEEKYFYDLETAWMKDDPASGYIH
jgi:hypothetical protein